MVLARQSRRGDRYEPEDQGLLGLRLTVLLPCGVSAARSDPGKDVEVEWVPFELRPEPHPTLRPEGDYLQRAWQQSVYPLARRMGVPITLPPVSPQRHTHLAFEGYQYAKEHDKGNEYNHRVLKAFFVEGQDTGQIDVLTKLAGEVGLNEKEFEEALRTR
jgi:predicted DsbA family dithiol-disulfide isomerase